jgi:tetratricopeptide (TPR) repeat protein
VRIPDDFPVENAELVLRYDAGPLGTFETVAPLHDLEEYTPGVQEVMIQARLHRQCGQHDDAAAALEWGLACHENHPYLLNQLAWFLLHPKGGRTVASARASGLAERAVAAFDDHELPPPERAAILYTLAIALEAGGKLNEALRRAEEAQALAPRIAGIRETAARIRAARRADPDGAGSPRPVRDPAGEEW